MKVIDFNDVNQAKESGVRKFRRRSSDGCGRLFIYPQESANLTVKRNLSRLIIGCTCKFQGFLRLLALVN